MSVPEMVELAARIDKLQVTLDAVLAKLTDPTVGRESFTVDEVAELLRKKPYTVREWCREGRLNATKRQERRAGAELWSISAVEVNRYRNEGLLPPDFGRNNGR